MTLQQRFDRTAGSLTLNGAGLPSFLVAVSGGVDSMTLATLFLHSELHPKFEAAHANFALRGAESDADEALVREWCTEHGIPLHIRRFDTPGYARENGISIEMAARQLRYGWFEELLKERKLNLIAVAHNLNDNVETLFLNLLRGTGLKGASGMNMISGNIFRPLIETDREEIESFAGESGIKWRTDHTNLESDYARNRIRNEIFPQLRKINPAFLRSISGSMEHFAQAQQVLDEETYRRMDLLTRRADNSLQVDIAALKREKNRSYWLYRILSGYGFNTAQIKEINDAIDRDGNVGKVFHSGHFTLVRDREFLKIYDSGDEIRSPGFKVISRDATFDPRQLGPGRLCVDADLVELPLKARLWRSGDRFTPFGMRGTRLVSDFLTDLKLDREKKRRQSVIEDAGGRIICVSGLRIDERFRITDKTKRIMIIS